MAETYSIKMPDGTVVPGVPVGLDPEKVVAQYTKDKEANAPSGMQAFKAGLGRSVANIGRNVGQVAGLVSEEDAAESARLDAPLLESGAGMAGNIVGETAAMLIPGGAAVRGGMAGGKLARAIAANPWKSAIAGGAVEGALISDPTNRVASTTIGAVGGGAGQALVRTLSGLAKGVTKKKPRLQEFKDTTGEDFVPITSAAVEGTMMSRIFKDILPAFPGGRDLVDQSGKAFTRWQKFMQGKVLPEGMEEPLNDDIAGNFGTLLRIWDDELPDELSNYVVKLSPPDGDYGGSELWKVLKGPKGTRIADPEIAKISNRIGKDGLVGTEDILDLRSHLIETSLKGTKLAKRNMADRVATMMREVRDDMPEEWQKLYDQIELRKGDYRALAAAGAKAKGSKFTPQDVESKGGQSVGEIRSAAGEGFLQEEGALASQVLGKELENPSFWRWVATIGLVGGLTTPLTALAMAAGGVGLTKAASAQIVQKALMGEVKAQRKLASLAAKNPELALQLKQAIRSVGATGAAQNAS